MIRKFVFGALCAVAISCQAPTPVEAQQPITGRPAWNGPASYRDYDRFMHYPYVYYPQNFYGNDYYRSSDSLYFRYPPEMQIPVYNRKWQNFYPNPAMQRYHFGHHFLTDVF